MEALNFSLHEYCDRIGYIDTIACNYATLEGLMVSQLYHIPFENSLVWEGKIPSLIPEEIVTKIIYNKKGGYCYEINALFAMALTAIGFTWYFVAARPLMYTERRPKTHLVIIVQLGEKRYLCDTGFGGYGIRKPLEVYEHEIWQDDEKFSLHWENNEYVVSSWCDNEPKPQYSFTLQEQEWIEFRLANYFNATSPDTIFTQKKLAFLQIPYGRKILIDEELKLIHHGAITIQKVNHKEALQKHFGFMGENI